MRSKLSDKTGAAIRKLRLARGWSLATLSEESGVPISTLSRVELGQNALNYDKLVRLCRALEVDLEGLMTREAEGSAAPRAKCSDNDVGINNRQPQIAIPLPPSITCHAFATLSLRRSCRDRTHAA